MSDEIDFQWSATISEFAKAFTAAQSKMQGAKKDSTNPFFNSTYADLASVREACLPALNANGICVIQSVFTKTPSAGMTWAGVKTILMHSSGEYCSGTLLLPVQGKQDAQAVTSAHTYGRRTSLAAMAGIAPVDEDGNLASAPIEYPKTSVDKVREFLKEKTGWTPSTPPPPEDAADYGASLQGTEPAQDEVFAEPKPKKGKSGLTLPFPAKLKGTPIEAAETKDLEWVKKSVGESLNDPAKAKFKANNQKLFDAIGAELQSRGGDVPF